ncbi:hypothetical protein [Lysinibacillus sp. fls2-241-R2A-57]|uniref:hypothetical protein n=1 Tax=Lysinibacillus sp. fls2-241-R2A-57 TaxID=3040292 RepID=UPI0025576DEA|nr:hypothetical protein [Lysinibacillus sp. fls2-241-R2A-57]
MRKRSDSNNEAEEAARRSPTGKRVAWNGNPPRHAGRTQTHKNRKLPQLSISKRTNIHLY